jgi:hypothetical protein
VTSDADQLVNIRHRYIAFGTLVLFLIAISMLPSRPAGVALVRLNA